MPAILAGWLVLTAGAASALDIFTLWRQPQLPLRLPAGGWVDYKRLTMATGRSDVDLFRLQSLGPAGADSSRLVLEILPLRELADGVLAPLPGEGLRVEVAASFLAREGQVLDAVRRVVRWERGVAEELPPAAWRDDPLVAQSFAGEFVPETVADQGRTTRVIGGRELVCRQLLFAAADTQSVDLPHGRLEQVTGQEVTAAVHPEIPLLGLAYAAERVRSESRLDPPSRRFRPPAPQTRVETLECVGFGTGARTHLQPVPAHAD